MELDANLANFISKYFLKNMKEFGKFNKKSKERNKGQNIFGKSKGI